MIYSKIIISEQKMFVYENDKIIREYLISTAKNGPGEVYGSEQTPRGWHQLRAKIGGDQPINTVFIKRRPTGEIFAPELKQNFPDRDWILTRIIWLSGLEPGKNRLGNVDTMRRFVYIHGTPDEVPMGAPGSRGCIRMRNAELVEFFNFIPIHSRLLIEE